MRLHRLTQQLLSADVPAALLSATARAGANARTGPSIKLPATRARDPGTTHTADVKTAASMKDALS